MYVRGRAPCRGGGICGWMWLWDQALAKWHPIIHLRCIVQLWHWPALLMAPHPPRPAVCFSFQQAPGAFTRDRTHTRDRIYTSDGRLLAGGLGSAPNRAGSVRSRSGGTAAPGHRAPGGRDNRGSRGSRSHVGAGGISNKGARPPLGTPAAPPIPSATTRPLGCPPPPPLRRSR